MTESSVKLARQITDYIQKTTPIKSNNGMSLSIDNISVDIPESNFDIENQLKMKYLGEGNTEGNISCTVRISDANGKVIYGPSHYKKFITFPVKTDRGTYIVNGVERNVVSQMRMKAGCYTNSSDNGEIKTLMRFNKGPANMYMPTISMVLDPASKKFEVEIKTFGKTVRFNVVNFLWLLGFNDAEISSAFGKNDIGDSVFQINSKFRNQKDMNTLFKVFFTKTSDGQGMSEAQKREMIWNFFSSNASFGDGDSIKSTLGMSKNNTYLNKEVVFNAVKKTVSVATGVIGEDLKDDFKYKEVYSDTDLIFESISTGLDNFFRGIIPKMDNHREGARAKSSAGLLSDMHKTIHAPLTSSNGLLQSELSAASEEINPLFMEAKQREISQGGPGAMSKNSMRNENAARNLTLSGVNKIDPVETPESGKIGMTQHLTVGAVIDNHTIKAKFYKVSNSKASTADKNIVQLTPSQEENSIIAYHDSRYVQTEGNEVIFTQNSVPCRYMGKNDMFPVSKIQYVDKEPQALLGTSTNMIPFVNHDDGPRVLMGAAMQKQAVNLVNRQAPMVTTLANKKTGMTYDQKIGEEYGKPVKSTLNGTVTEITNSKIIVTDNSGKTAEHPYYNYYPLNQSYINNELKVKVGDKVSSGQIIAEGWQTDSGKLALGVNANIGFIPYKGYNYEDGIVISESFAKQMTSDEYDEVEVYIPKNSLGGIGSGIKRELMLTSSDAAISKLDKDGVATVGTVIKEGSTLAGVLLPLDKEGDDVLDRFRALNSNVKYKYSGRNVPQGSYVAGEIKRIVHIDNPDNDHKQKIIFSVVNQKPLKLGDKISGRHGNKGTVTKILPDKLMPVADGKPLDIMMSPLAVPSRKNPGQLLEVGAGLVAMKTGKPFVVDNFNHSEKERVLEELKKIGCPDGKMNITLKEEDDNGNIKEVKMENPATVGSMYIMKLKHKVDDKIQARSNFETPVTAKSYMPQKVTGTSQGEKSNPQRLGEMEMRALQAHGAAWNLLEDATIKADGAGDGRGKAAIFKAISTGTLDAAELSRNATPESVKILSDTLKPLGLDVVPSFHGVKVGTDKPFDSLGLVPINQSEFIKTVGSDKEVFSKKMFKARQLYGDKGSKSSQESKTAPDEKGGLFDTNIFGDKDEEDRNKWGYIKLPTPMPNPLFMDNSSNNVYSILTGLSSSEIKNLSGIGDSKSITNSQAMAVVTNLKDLENKLSNIGSEELVKHYSETAAAYMAENNIKEGDLIPVKVIDDLLINKGVKIPNVSGGLALKEVLKKIDVEKGLEDAKKELDAAKGAGIDKAYKKVRAFEMLKNNNLKPEDLLVKYLPVTPTYMRPAIMPKTSEDGIIINDLNKLYGKVLSSKGVFEERSTLDGNGDVDPESMTGMDYVQQTRHLYSSLQELQGKAVGKDNGRELASLKDNISGKTGIIRKTMLGKRVDFSGRSVITVNPNLGLNEVGIPLDMAKQIYAPFIIKALVDQGICKNAADAEKRLQNPDNVVKKVIQRVAEDRPTQLNRQPSLHKYSIQSLTPVIKEHEDGSVVRSIQLNPLIVTGFNADFDGDSCINSIFTRKKVLGDKLWHKISDKQIWEDNNMPFDKNTRIRYKYGVINLGDFPRLELLETKGNKEIYKVPKGIEVLTVWNGIAKWIEPESFSIHKDLDMLEVKTNTSRTVQASNDHSFVSVDDELNYKRCPAEKGITVPRVRKPVSDKEGYESLKEFKLDKKKESKYTLKTNKLTLDFDMGYGIGVYVGDGWASEREGKYAICLANRGNDLINKVADIFGKYFNEDIHICTTQMPHEFKGYSSYSEKHTWSSSTFNYFLRECIGSGAKDKHLPDFWMHTDDKFRWGLLSGLIDTDGSVSRCHAKIKANPTYAINYTTISRQLAYEIVALSETLNLTASVTVYQLPNGNECYQIMFSQESVAIMQKELKLVTESKAKCLAEAKFSPNALRNKYTPKLSNERLQELRRYIGSPRILKGMSEEEVKRIKKIKSLYIIVHRVESQNTAIRKDVAMDLFDTVPGIFESGFWAKWKAMVLDPDIEWELITSIKPIEFITEAYDLTIPPAYTMVTESGIVIYDTMAVHVPVTEKAKEEAKKTMMPYQNLINPTDGKMIIEIRHEMALGIYQLTSKWEKPTGSLKNYTQFKDLQNDYLMGKINHTQRVKVPIYQMETTAGQALFNWVIPEKMSQFRNFRKTWNKKEISTMFMEIYETAEATDFKSMSKLEISKLYEGVKDLGFKAATRTGVSIGVKDFSFDDKVTKQINTILSKGKDTDDIETWRGIEKEIEGKLKEGLLPEDSPLQVMMNSGARADAQQIRKMFAVSGTGMDVEQNLLKPIKNSLFDGLSPQDYYTLGKDARKGIYDRSVSTEAPGVLTRQVWSATQDITIKEKDCHTNDFIMVKKTDRTVKGRYAGKDILNNSGKVICKHNKMITSEIYAQIFKDDSIEYVPVRSTLRCKTVGGKCQMCYGAMAGTTEPAKIGTAIGVIASQALGEPVTQMTMNTFHTGGANSSAVSGLPKIQSILNLSTSPKNKAVLAEASGQVTEIITTPSETIILIGKKKHIVKNPLGGPALSIKVKKGDFVHKGDFLTSGDLSDISSVYDDNKTTITISNADPKKLFALKTQEFGQENALNYTKDYLSDSMQYAIQSANTSMDRRHTETIISKLTSTGKVMESGDSPYLKGQRADINLFEKWNKDNCNNTNTKDLSPTSNNLVGRISVNDITVDGVTICRKGSTITNDMLPELLKYKGTIKVRLKPIVYQAELKGQIASSNGSGWLSNLGGNGGGAMNTLAAGGALGSVDKLEDPRSQLMTGKLLNIGSGAEYTDDFRNRFTNKMSNFFNNKIDFKKFMK